MDFWFAVTQLGLPEAWASISAAMVITYLILRFTVWKKDSKEKRVFKAAALLMVLSVGITFILVHAVKETARVPRPCVPCGEGADSVSCNPYCIEGDYSFPSGHAATAFAVATVAMLIWRRPCLILLAVASLVAFSRVALGVHALQDIVAGALIGIAVPLFVHRIKPRTGILA